MDGSFTFQNISTDVIETIRQASAASNGTTALTIVAADAPTIPLKVVAVTQEAVIVTLQTGETANIPIPAEFFESNPEVTFNQVVGTSLTLCSSNFERRKSSNAVIGALDAYNNH